MKKTILVSIILIIILFTFTGCYYTNGIDDYYFIISLGLDAGTDGLLKLSVQISSTTSEDSSSSSDSSQSSNYQIYSVEAKTIDECITILNNYLNKEINLSHCSALIISEELAKKGLNSYINTLSNNTELRHTCQVIISSSTAYDVLDKVSNSGEVFSARFFDYLATSTDYTGFTITSSFGDFFQALENNYYEPSAIYTVVSDDTIQTSGIAVFKQDYMVGHLNVINSIAHLATTNKLNTCIVTIDSPFYENEKIDLELNLYKDTEISVDIINGSPFISVQIYPEGTIKSSGSTFNYIDNNEIETLEKATNAYLENIFKEYFYNISKEYNADIVGFKSICQSTILTKEEFNKIHWDDIFQDSFFDVTINTKINSSNLFNKK